MKRERDAGCLASETNLQHGRIFLVVLALPYRKPLRGNSMMPTPSFRYRLIVVKVIKIWQGRHRSADTKNGQLIVYSCDQHEFDSSRIVCSRSCDRLGSNETFLVHQLGFSSGEICGSVHRKQASEPASQRASSQSSCRCATESATCFVTFKHAKPRWDQKGEVLQL